MRVRFRFALARRGATLLFPRGSLGFPADLFSRATARGGEGGGVEIVKTPLSAMVESDPMESFFRSREVRLSHFG